MRTARVLVRGLGRLVNEFNLRLGLLVYSVCLFAFLLMQALAARHALYLCFQSLNFVVLLLYSLLSFSACLFLHGVQSGIESALKLQQIKLLVR